MVAVSDVGAIAVEAEHNQLGNHGETAAELHDVVDALHANAGRVSRRLEYR